MDRSEGRKPRIAIFIGLFGPATCLLNQAKVVGEWVGIAPKGSIRQRVGKGERTLERRLRTARCMVRGEQEADGLTLWPKHT